MRTAPFRSLAMTALSLMLLSPVAGWSETPAQPAPMREVILSAARKFMMGYPHCALTTVNAASGPSIRTVSPLQPDEDMTVWIATRDDSRKVQEIKKNPRVALYYANHEKAEGYVALSGKATLVTDQTEITKRHQADWDFFFPDAKHIMLIKVVPERLEVLNFKEGLSNGFADGAVPSIVFPAK